MATSTIKSIQFKRGTKAVLTSQLVGDNKPLRGEPIWETDTNKLKIGDGNTDYEKLPYVTGDGGSISSDIIMVGYYDSETDIFWKEPTKVNALPRLTTSLYIDKLSTFIYYLQNNKYTSVFRLASKDSYGLSKLYTSTGQNIDGTITQKALTDTFNNIVDVSEEDELLDIRNNF